MSKSHAAIAALTLSISSPTNELQILPAGKFRGIDGRPEEAPHWYIDRAIAERVIADIDARSNPLVIDYEHQILHKEKNGQPAIAAAWFKKLEWRDGDGLYATDVTWTDRAAAHIAANEYKFFSPVFFYHPKTGHVQRLLHGGLTNNPALDGMNELQARAAAHFSFSTEEDMEALEALNTTLKAFGLKTETTIEAAQAALTAYHTTASANAASVAALTASVTEKDGQIAALSAKSPDPAKYVPVETVSALQTKVADLTNRISEREVDEVVVAALSDGRLLAEQEPWARNYGKTDLPGLKEFIAKAKPIAALTNSQTNQGKPPAIDKDAPLNEAELAMCTNMGLDPAKYKETKLAAA